MHWPHTVEQTPGVSLCTAWQLQKTVYESCYWFGLANDKTDRMSDAAT